MPAEEVQLRLIHLLIGARLGQVGSAALQAAQNATHSDAAPPTFPGRDLLLKAFTGSHKKDLLQGLLRSLQSFAARVCGLLGALSPMSVFRALWPVARSHRQQGERPGLDAKHNLQAPMLSTVTC